MWCCMSTSLGSSLWCVLMYEVFFKFYSSNEDIKPSAAFSCGHIKYKIHAQECTKTRHYYFKNSKIFWGGGTEGTAPSPDPYSSGRGTPPPALTPLSACGASIFAPSTLTHAPPPPLGSLATGLWFSCDLTPRLSTVFKSAICVLTFRLLFIYFQNFFRIFYIVTQCLTVPTYVIYGFLFLQYFA